MPTPQFFNMLFRVAFTGAIIIGRAVIAAFSEAAAEGAKHGKSGGSILSALSGRSQSAMTTQEAMLILNVEKGKPQEEIIRTYRKLFKANDPLTGGSFYLQSKVYRARQQLERDGVIKREPKPSTTSSQS
eukprot:c1761_g1_i1.p1 GENE.c1761_g1_i1~~c1761_g1_i1.p1  ORF type:complete len:130 (+),score=59.66 c1761_g1_i1:127-516(+)